MTTSRHRFDESGLNVGCSRVELQERSSASATHLHGPDASSAARSRSTRLHHHAHSPDRQDGKAVFLRAEVSPRSVVGTETDPDDVQDGKAEGLSVLLPLSKGSAHMARQCTATERASLPSRVHRGSGFGRVGPDELAHRGSEDGREQRRRPTSLALDAMARLSGSGCLGSELRWQSRSPGQPSTILSSLLFSSHRPIPARFRHDSSGTSPQPMECRRREFVGRRPAKRPIWPSMNV